MHVLAAGMIGSVVAIGVVVFSGDRIMALLYSPLVVSATIVALGLLPERRRS